jgi:hypothetical protein
VIDLTEIKKWIGRQLDVKIGPGRGNGHGKKAKKHKKND